MDKMNLFNRKGKSSKALFGDNKPKANTKLKKKTYSEDFKKKAVNLASKVGVTKAAEELGVSTSSIYSWQKTLAKSPAPIQDENGNLTFELEGKTYSLNVNSKFERIRIKAEVNANSLAKYYWFKEETGEKHWVLYDIAMYEIIYNSCLRYIDDCTLTPVIPINATSCHRMFHGCKALTQLNLSNFNTSQITDMSSMFAGCEKLTELDLSNFDTHKVTNMSGMFDYCKKLTKLNLSNFNTSKVTNMSFMFEDCSALTQLDISNFDTSNVIEMYSMFCICEELTQLDLSNFDISNVTDMHGMFYNCAKLAIIYVSDKWNVNKVTISDNMFSRCNSLINFNPEKVEIEMAKSIEQGGYLILKK